MDSQPLNLLTAKLQSTGTFSPTLFWSKKFASGWLGNFNGATEQHLTPVRWQLIDFILAFQ